MKISTTNFGELEIPKENIISFKNGILGFADYKEYVIVNDEEGSPFCWLQSVDEPDLAFVMVNPYQVHEDYNPKFPPSQIGSLGEVESDKDYSVLSITNIPDEVENMSANLMAPVVINVKTKKAVQIITEDSKYPLKYYLFEQLQKQKAK